MTGKRLAVFSPKELERVSKISDIIKTIENGRDYEAFEKRK